MNTDHSGAFLYQTKFRGGTLVVRLFITALAVILFLTGALASVGMLLSQRAETGALVFIFLTLSISFIIFKASAWNIRAYALYEDRLVVNILWGIKTITYPASDLRAFNDLRAFAMTSDEGIGIVTTDNKLIKITALEVADFPLFIAHLQKIVRWDLNLKYKASLP